MKFFYENKTAKSLRVGGTYAQSFINIETKYALFGNFFIAKIINTKVFDNSYKAFIFGSRILWTTCKVYRRFFLRFALNTLQRSKQIFT